MANMHLVTGHGGQNHVTAADHGSLNAAILGNGEYVLGRGNKLAATVVSNNCIRIADGDILMQGRHIRLNEGAYVDLTIENGEQGKLRHDLIVCRYTMNSLTGVEEANLVVIKGTAVESNPQDPEYTSADIITDHAFLADMPLYRVPLDGLNVGELVPLFTVSNGVATLDADGKLAQMPTVEDIGAATSNHKHTAAEVGAATAGHTHTPSEIGAATRPNILANWYLSDPVNQRGQTEYAATGFAIDRWRIDGTKLVVGDGCCHVSANRSTQSFFMQTTNVRDIDLGSRPMVFSVYLKDGTLISGKTGNGIGFLAEYKGGSFWIYGTVGSTKTFSTVIRFNEGNTVTLDIVAIKVEFGSQQSLARQENGVWILNDTPPEKSLEAFKCSASTAESADTYANGGRAFIKGTAELTAGTSALANGSVYLQYS